MDRSGRRRVDRTKNLVGFAVGDVNYAVQILAVREVINPLPIVELPHAPEAVLGVVDHRGEVVPIVDLRRRFGLPPAPSGVRIKWIIVRVEDRPVGLVVDSVTDVFGAGANTARGVPELGVGDSARGIEAAFRHEGTLVFVLDMARVAAPAATLDVTGLHEAAEANAALESGRDA